MHECEELVQLVKKQADVLRRRGDIFGRMAEGVEEGDLDRMREACREMEDLQERHARLPREVVEHLREVCARYGVPEESATLGRLVEAVDGSLESELAAARRELAGALARAREARDRVQRLASVASDWNAHILGAVWAAVPGGQTYSASGEMESPERGVLQGAWG